MALVTLVANTRARASHVNGNFALCVLTDTARTIAVTHVWSAAQTFSGGFASAGTSTFSSGLTVSAGTAAMQAITGTTLGLTSHITQNNDCYLKGSTSGSVLKKVIGVTSGNVVQIDGDGLGATTGAALTAAGALRSSSTTGGVGYATGAGGTVTQLTNKNTDVTLNKPCGIITMHNASISAGAYAEFTLINSTIAVGDIVVVALGNGGSAQQYQCWVEYTDGFGSGGACLIVVKNISGSPIGEALKIHFAVIKSVTA